jgi:hypothetical protein
LKRRSKDNVFLREEEIVKPMDELKNVKIQQEPRFKLLDFDGFLYDYYLGY